MQAQAEMHSVWGGDELQRFYLNKSILTEGAFLHALRAAIGKHLYKLVVLFCSYRVRAQGGIPSPRMKKENDQAPSVAGKLFQDVLRFIQQHAYATLPIVSQQSVMQSAHAYGI